MPIAACCIFSITTNSSTLNLINSTLLFYHKYTILIFYLITQCLFPFGCFPFAIYEYVHKMWYSTELKLVRIEPFHQGDSYIYTYDVRKTPVEQASVPHYKLYLQWHQYYWRDRQMCDSCTVFSSRDIINSVTLLWYNPKAHTYVWECTLGDWV